MAFNDGYTQMVTIPHMGEFEERIYDIEDGISTLEENASAMIEYLRDVRCSMPLGLALRRYICTRFGNESQGGHSFTLTDGSTVTVGDYMRGDYDIQTDDIKEYTDIFMDINARYNTDDDGKLISDINKAEARRMLRVTGGCQRAKLFSISFALHMDSEAVYKLLTDVLAEQSYNYRDPCEIIAYYCHSHEDVNSFIHYQRLCGEYRKLIESAGATAPVTENYTRLARRTVTVAVETEQQLMEFLVSNRQNFTGYSQTAYDEFMSLYAQALQKTRIQSLSNDEYLSSARPGSAEQLRDREDRINRAIGLTQVTNTEQLAKAMLQFIPRATSEKQKGGKKIVSSDFISVSSGEGKKAQTTTLPKDITMNLLMKDRLDDLIRQVKPVDRKDLVFLRFFLFSLELEQKDGYSAEDYRVFNDECNDMLMRCGMSRLYPANRFENLILLSLLSSRPFEMFEDIIESSFINEPTAE